MTDTRQDTLDELRALLDKATLPLGHEWVSKSGRPWSLRVKSDACARCGRTPDAHDAVRVPGSAVNALPALLRVAEAALDAMDVADLYADDNDNPLWDDIPVELADKLTVVRAALDALEHDHD